MVMSIKLYNTLSRSLEPLEPLEEGRVGLYTCGPTVYNQAHIGNFRAYVFEDLLRRHLQFRGLQVTQVQNLTDVDDKTIRGAREKGVSLADFTAPFKKAFFEDIRTLNIEPAEYYPAATEHVPEMIALIRSLLDKGYAYQSEDGSVYFGIARFPGYGKLARLDKSGMRSGARVSQDEYQKDDLADFALWKAWDAADGEVGWDSPWGRGRPGWHIECSAMSMKYLGETFDIHTGGVDNIFPHHEDEIAQSEAANGKPFARCWLHCAHLVVEGRKMSKSLGNFYTLRDVLGHGYSGREIRYVLISTHYRQSLNFSFAALDAARSSLARLDAFGDRLQRSARGAGPGKLPRWAEERRRAFGASLDEDLNISAALAVLFDLVHDGNRALDGSTLEPESAAAVSGLLAEWDRVLGFIARERERPQPDVLEMLEQRSAARRRKDFEEADRLRDAIRDRGWEIEDLPGGPELKRR